ncbi:Holin family protein [compost metagenome]
MNPISFDIIIEALGAIATYTFGAWSELIGLFLLTILIDYVTSIAASFKERRCLNFWGLTHKGLMLFVIILAHRMDSLMGTDIMMTCAIYFYLANEFISITENYGRLGLPLPNFVKQMIQVLRSKGEGL